MNQQVFLIFKKYCEFFLNESKQNPSVTVTLFQRAQQLPPLVQGRAGAPGQGWVLLLLIY